MAVEERPQNNESVAEQAAMLDELLQAAGSSKAVEGPYKEANEPFYGREEEQDDSSEEQDEQAEYAESEEEESEDSEGDEGEDEEQEESEETDLAALKRQNDMLLQRLDQLAEQTGQTRQDVMEGQQQVQQQAPAITPLEDILTEEDIEKAYSDPKVFNNALRKVYEKAIQDASQVALQQQMPALQQYVGQQIYMRQKADEFYQKNQDLAKHRQFVGHVAQKVVQENPTMTIDQMYSETEKRARKELGLIKKNGPAQPKGKPPKAKGTNKPGKGNKQPVSEFEELLY